MTIGSPSASSVAGLVWTQPTRTLTGIAALAARFQGNPSVGAGIVLDLRPAVGKYREVDSFGFGGAQFRGGYYDGATFVQPGVEINAGGQYTARGDSVFGPAIKNT